MSENLFQRFRKRLITDERATISNSILLFFCFFSWKGQMILNALDNFKEIMLEIGFTGRKKEKRELLEVIKKYSKPCSTIFLICENRFNPYNSVPLATLRFRISWHQKRMALQISCRITNAKFDCCRITRSLYNMTMTRSSFCKNLQIANFMQNKQRKAILQQILLSYPFLMSPNFKT